MPHTLKIENLACQRREKLLFANISFELAQGKLLLVEGPNGCGKSSLLRLLAALTPAFKGTIYWHAKNIENLRTDFQQQLHYLGHKNGLKLGLTVKENLQLLQSCNRSLMAHEKICQELHLNPNQPAECLSAGQKRRLALAKIFYSPKPLWILDEPCTSLDSQTQELFFFYLRNHLQNNGMAVMSTHQFSFFNLTGTNAQRLQLGPC